MADRIRVVIEGESEDLVREAKKAGRALKGLGQETRLQDKITAATYVDAQGRMREANGRFVTSQKQARRENDLFGSSIRRTSGHVGLLQRMIGLLKWPSLIAGAGAAAQGLNSLAAGAVGLVSALTPLTGALTAYPALLGAMGQAAGVVALSGIKDLTGGLQGNQQALQRLTPQGRSFLTFLKGLKPQYDQLRASVQKPLFSGAEAGLRSAMHNFGALRSVMTQTSRTMGGLAADAGRLVGSKGFGKDFQTIGTGNARLLDHLGHAGLSFANALRHVMVEAQPLVGWMGKLIDGWGQSAAQSAKAARSQGTLSSFFDRTRQVMSQLISIAGNLIGGFKEIGKAALPLGQSILDEFVDLSKQFRDWTASVSGQNALREYFTRARPALYEVGQLVGDLVKAFFTLGQSSGFTELVHQLRTQLLPVLEQTVASTTAAFGPHLVAALTQVLKLIATMSGSTGPLTIFVDVLGRMAQVLNFLFKQSPFLKSTVMDFMAIGGIIKALSFASAISGVGKLIELFRSLAVAAGIATAAETAAGAAAGGAGAGIAGAGGAAARRAADRAAAGAAEGAGGGALGGLLARLGLGGGEAAAGEAAGLGAAGTAAVVAVPALIAAGGAYAALKTKDSYGELGKDKLGNSLDVDNKIAQKLHEQLDTHKAITAETGKQVLAEAQYLKQSGDITKEQQHQIDLVAQQKSDLGGIAQSMLSGFQSEIQRFRSAGATKASALNYSIGDVISQFQQMEPAARKAAAGSMITMASTLAAQGKLPVGQVKALIRSIKTAFPGMEVPGINAAQKLARGLTGTFQDLAKAVRDPLGSITDAVNSLLSGLDLPTINFSSVADSAKNTIDQIGNFLGLGGNSSSGGGGKKPKKSQTGAAMVPDQGAFGDRFPVNALLERGEIFGVFNRNAAKAITAANETFPRFGPSKLAEGGILEVAGERAVQIAAAAAERWAKKHAGGPMVSFGEQIASHHFPYVYGGGHGSFAPPYDCSGFVSAILHAGGLLSSPMTTDGLKNWGLAGPGKFVTVGVRGSTGRSAHTMMEAYGHFFESGGSAGGASEVGGWDGAFPIKRHPRGLQRGGVMEYLRAAGFPIDPQDPNFLGWGLQKGGAISPHSPKRPTIGTSWLHYSGDTLTPNEIFTMVRQLGGSREDGKFLSSVAFGESTYRIHAHGPPDGRGIVQVDVSQNPQYKDWNLYNPWEDLVAGIQLHHQGAAWYGQMGPAGHLLKDRIMGGPAASSDKNKNSGNAFGLVGGVSTDVMGNLIARTASSRVLGTLGRTSAYPVAGNIDFATEQALLAANVATSAANVAALSGNPFDARVAAVSKQINRIQKAQAQKPGKGKGLFAEHFRQLPKKRRQQLNQKRKANLAGKLAARQQDLSVLQAAQSAYPDQASDALSLVTDQLRANSANLALSQRLQGAFALPLVGAFKTGGRVPMTGLGLLHKDEQVLPAPKGPTEQEAARQGGGDRPIQVTVYNEGDATALLRQVRAEVDGKVAKVDQRLGGNARRLAYAPGG